MKMWEDDMCVRVCWLMINKKMTILLTFAWSWGSPFLALTETPSKPNQRTRKALKVIGNESHTCDLHRPLQLHRLLHHWWVRAKLLIVTRREKIKAKTRWRGEGGGGNVLLGWVIEVIGEEVERQKTGLLCFVTFGLVTILLDLVKLFPLWLRRR